MSSLAVKHVDFPVGYAEVTEHGDSDTVYYVEWLDNGSEFPDLTGGSNKKHQNNVDPTWELLEHHELDHEDLTLVADEDNWSKINAFNKHSYVEVAEKNADELKPTKRALQPLWPPIPKTAEASTDESNTSEDEDCLDCYSYHKSQSKTANRSSHLRRLRQLKLADNQFPAGFYQLATSKDGPTEDITFDDKAAAVKFCSEANLANYYKGNKLRTYRKSAKLGRNRVSIDEDLL